MRSGNSDISRISFVRADEEKHRAVRRDGLKRSHGLIVPWRVQADGALMQEYMIARQTKMLRTEDVCCVICEL